MKRWTQVMLIVSAIEGFYLATSLEDWAFPLLLFVAACVVAVALIEAHIRDSKGVKP